jgi:hypothetical protein
MKTSLTQHASALTIDVLKSQIGALEAIDSRIADIDEIGKRFKAIADGYACLTRIIDTPYAYRARRNKLRAPFEHISEVWYPQPGDVKTLGRVNRVGQPMFYISASHATATLELRPAIGDVMTLLSLQRINLGRQLHVMEIGVAEKESLHALPRSVHLLEETPFGQHFLQSTHGMEHNLAIRSYLAREFTRIVARGNEHEFKKTIAIGEFLLASEQIDGVQYPSIAGDTSQWKGGANLVLKPKAADALFEPFECWMIEVEGIQPPPESGFMLRCIGKAKEISKDGRIQWK